MKEWLLTDDVVTDHFSDHLKRFWQSSILVSFTECIPYPSQLRQKHHAIIASNEESRPIVFELHCACGSKN